MHNATLSKSHFDAVLFDLDGVITKTAGVHAACWKKLFDDFLRDHAISTQQVFVPFDPVSDYTKYVDGKLRQEGVADFLASRGISLPLGDSSAACGQHTVRGLACRKDEIFNTVLQEKGVEVLEDGLALVGNVRANGFKTAVVSSSKNCRLVLQMANIEKLFDIRVDGVTVEQLGLKGKPHPDTFLKAADMLGVQPKRSVVVEDAIAGVQAGRRGNFGLVIGVDRQGNASALRNNGADIVVTDLRFFIG